MHRPTRLCPDHFAPDPVPTFYDWVLEALECERISTDDLGPAANLYKGVVYLAGGAYLLSWHAARATPDSLCSLFLFFHALRSGLKKIPDAVKATNWEISRRRPGRRVRYGGGLYFTPFEAAKSAARRALKRFDEYLTSACLQSHHCPVCEVLFAARDFGNAETAAAIQRHFSWSDYGCPADPTRLILDAREDAVRAGGLKEVAVAAHVDGAGRLQAPQAGRLVEVSLAKPSDPRPIVQESACPVVLLGESEGLVVNGVRKQPVTHCQYRVLQALVKAYPGRLSYDELQNVSGDAVNVLKRLAKGDRDWGAAIDLPAIKGRGYGLRPGP